MKKIVVHTEKITKIKGSYRNTLEASHAMFENRVRQVTPWLPIELVEIEITTYNEKILVEYFLYIV